MNEISHQEGVVGFADRSVSRTFELTARWRRARVFHPVGLPLAGMLQALDPRCERLIGGPERPAAVRISKGIGLPAGIPDVLGLALRVPDRDGRPWDLALATTGTNPLTRLLPLPARGWRSARYGSLMPYRIEDGPAEWLGAHPGATQPDTAELRDFLESVHHRPTTFDLTTTTPSGPPRPFARLLLTDMEVGNAPTYFDPVRNHPPTIALLPQALATIREWAYSGSRTGRTTPHPAADAAAR